MVTFDVGVVGGGLGGLAVAALVGRKGRTACVFEKSTTAGGRAVTHEEKGYLFNLGAHALYRGGAASRVLRTLGVEVTGRPPPLDGAIAVHGDAAHDLPTGALSLALTSLLRPRAKLEGARLLARLSSLNWRALEGTPLSAWLDEALRDPTLRELFGALYRLTSYANAPETQSAGAAVGQLAFSTKTGVVYLDGGWQTLVDGTVAACAAHGVVIRTGAAVTEARPLAGGWAVRCADGSAVACRTLVLATSPGAAAAITRIGALDSWASAAIPAKAACLDVALESLPRPGTRLALGIDQPLYFSVHSASARLAPEGGALVSTIKYLPHGEAPDAKRDATELEAWLDRLQPGWRERVIARRYLPQLVVSHAIPTASQGGLEGRPPTRVPDAERLFVVGDWVGHEGVLLDAVLASAEAAGGAILEDERLATVA